MGRCFVLIGFLILMNFQLQSMVISQNISTTKEPMIRPILPTNPTMGGKASNPGAVLRIAKRLLVSNVQQACRDAEKKKPESRSVKDVVLNLPDGQLVVGQLRLVSLALPLALGDIYPPNQLCWCTDQGRLSAAGLWTYTPNNASVKYSGNVYVPPSLFVAQVNSTLGRTPEHQPAITTVDCRIRLNVSKTFFSSSTPLSRIFMTEVESNITLLIKEALEEYVCEVISTALRLALNSILVTFKTKIVLWESPKIIVDYSLITDPYVDPVDSSINGLLKGMITVNGATVPFYPHDLATIDNSTRPMVAALFSDFMLNSLLYSSYQANLLRVTATPDFSKKVGELLRLDCDDDEICVKTVFPPISALQNASAELTVTATQAPTTIFMESKAFMQISGSLSLDIKMANSVAKINRLSSPFYLTAVLQPSAIVQKKQTVIAMEAKIIDLRLLTIPASTDISTMRNRLVSLLVSILEEIMNKFLRVGVPAPSFNDTRLARFNNPVLSLYNRTLILQCSIY